jgi:hypothetical protein
MKLKTISHIVAAILLTTASGFSQTTFFSDSFSNGSTLTNTTPAIPRTNAANYTLTSTKAWAPAPSIAPNDFRYGIASSASGVIESQCLFTTNTITLVEPGDYVQLTVVFTNNNGILEQSCQPGFGLYNTGQTNPIAGGLYGNASSAINVPGGTTEWAGYVAQFSFNGGSDRIMTRAAQTGITANDQDLATSGSGTSSYGNPPAGGIGSTVPSTLIMTNGYTYTEVLNITLLAAGSEAITNMLYSGPDTNSPVLAQFGAIATNSTYLTSSFDGLAMGWRSTATNTGGTVIDISSIKISGQQSVLTVPPVITSNRCRSSLPPMVTPSFPLPPPASM